MSSSYSSCFSSSGAAAKCAQKLHHHPSVRVCSCGKCGECKGRSIPFNTLDTVLDYFFEFENKLYGGMNRNRRWVVLKEPLTLTPAQKAKLNEQRRIRLNPATIKQQLARFSQVVQHAKAMTVHALNVAVVPTTLGATWLEMMNRPVARAMCAA